jgi:hypothetical protein
MGLNMERLATIEKQGWNEKTIKHLMEYFIEEEGLGERFDAYLERTAKSENGEERTFVVYFGRTVREVGAMTVKVVGDKDDAMKEGERILDAAEDDDCIDWNCKDSSYVFLENTNPFLAEEE